MLNPIDLIKAFVTAKSAWIKYTIVIILAVSVLAYVYDAGKRSERSEWLDMEQKFLAKQSAIKEENSKRIKEYQAKYDEILMGAFNNYEQERKNLNNRIDELGNKRMYVTASKDSGCNRLSTKAKDSSVIDSAPSRVELSGADGENVRNDYGTAQRLVLQYEELRAICLPLVDVVE